MQSSSAEVEADGDVCLHIHVALPTSSAAKLASLMKVVVAALPMDVLSIPACGNVNFTRAPVKLLESAYRRAGS